MDETDEAGETREEEKSKLDPSMFHSSCSRQTTRSAYLAGTALDANIDINSKALIDVISEGTRPVLRRWKACKTVEAALANFISNMYSLTNIC